MSKPLTPEREQELEEFARSIGLPPFRRWYRFGWRSPIILWKRNRVRHWPFRLRMTWQRARRGYGDDDMWSVNYTIATLIVVGCRNMRENGFGYPTEFSDPPEGNGGGWDEWAGILLRMEEGFQAWLDEDGWFSNAPEQEAKFNDAMALFAEWFGGLWD